MYQALYRKWRPLHFADVIGQQHITDTLRAQLNSGRLSHAYLFTGTRGTGKTTCAKLLARAVNCENLQNGDPCGTCPACLSILENGAIDVVEIDAASNNGVDNVREIRDEVRYQPTALRKKVYIIDEVHMLSTEAFNALLKTLEEPPDYVVFILATTEIHKVPATILSRCQRYDFRRITLPDISARLQVIAQAENINLTADGATLLARLSDGAMRDALSMLDRTAGYDVVDAQVVSSSLGILTANDAVSLLTAIRAGDLVRAVQQIGTAYESGRDLSGVLDQLLGLLRDILLCKTAQSDVSALLSPTYTFEQVQALGQGVASATLMVYTRMLQETINRMKQTANRRVEAELCMVRLCTVGAEQYDSLSGRVEALEEKVKHGIPMVQVAPAQAGNADDDAPPPWDDSDAPPPEEDDMPPWVQEDSPAPVKAKKPAPAPKQDWPQWQQVLDVSKPKMIHGMVNYLPITTRAERVGERLHVLCEDSIALNWCKEIRDILMESVAQVAGMHMELRFYEEGAQPVVERNPLADTLLANAAAGNIPITQMEE